MATYKTANNLPILEEVTENTYALVEDNGSLKRVSGSNLGGGNGGNACVFYMDTTQQEMSPMSMENTDSSGIIYSCNMSPEEIFNKISNKTLESISLIQINFDSLIMYHGQKLFFESEGVVISFYTHENNDWINLRIKEDNTIEQYFMVS